MARFCVVGPELSCKGPLYPRDGELICEKHFGELLYRQGTGPWRFTREEYEEAIEYLKDGMKQLEPDGGCCAVCGDSGHQAFECHHNPLVIMKRYRGIVAAADELHDHLHSVLGFR